MSKFRYSLILARSVGGQAGDVVRRSRAGPAPRRPTRRSAACSWSADAWPAVSAVSRMAALPEPLSLMPGPSGTLSRWAPAMTTLVRVAPAGLGDDVVASGGSRTWRRRLEVHGPSSRRVGQLLADGEASAHDRGMSKRRRRRACRRERVGAARLALVEDDHDRDGAGRLGVERPCRGTGRCRAGSARCCPARTRRSRLPRSRRWSSGSGRRQDQVDTLHLRRDIPRPE